MAVEPPYREPKTIVIGEKLHWKRSLPDYPATLYTIEYRYRGNTGDGFNVTASADGSDYEIEVAGSVTAGLTAETYSWQAWLTEIADTDNSFLADKGTVEVETGFTTGSTAAVDQRTQAETILAAIRAVIASKATEDQLSYRIQSGNGERELKKMTWTELISAEKHYQNIVAREKRNRRLSEGGPLMKSYPIRMRNP